MSEQSQVKQEAASRRIHNLLAHMPLFSTLSQEELAPIVAGTAEIIATRGQTIVRQGEPCTGFFFIVHGQVKIIKTSPEGLERVIRIFGAGKSFGEAIMFLRSDYIVSVEALCDTALLHIKRETIFDQIDKYPAVAHKMLGGLSQRLHSMVKDIESYTLFSGAQRLIGYILREWGDDRQSFRFQTSKSVIASRLNLTPEHFSRILRDLSDKGLIEVHGREFTILDPEGLWNYKG